LKRRGPGPPPLNDPSRPTERWKQEQHQKNTKKKQSQEGAEKLVDSVETGRWGREVRGKMSTFRGDEAYALIKGGKT